MSELPSDFGRDPVDFRVPDFIGEIKGWRAWLVVGTPLTPRLMSVTMSVHKAGVDAIWPTQRWFRAICPEGKGHDREIPVESCSCGIYAAKDRAQLVNLGYGVYGNRGGPKVIGEVAFAGKVIPGTQGYRAEKARIVRLICPYELYAKWGDGLARAYRVPVDVGFLFGEKDRRKAQPEGR